MYTDSLNIVDTRGSRRSTAPIVASVVVVDSQDEGRTVAASQRCIGVPDDVMYYSVTCFSTNAVGCSSLSYGSL